MALASNDAHPITQLRSPRKPDDPLLGTWSQSPCNSWGGCSTYSGISHVRSTSKPDIDLLDDPSLPLFDAEPLPPLRGESDTKSWPVSEWAQLEAPLTKTKSGEPDRYKNESDAFLIEFRRRRACFHHSTQSRTQKDTHSWVTKAFSIG